VQRSLDLCVNKLSVCLYGSPMRPCKPTQRHWINNRFESNSDAYPSRSQHAACYLQFIMNLCTDTAEHKLFSPVTEQSGTYIESWSGYRMKWLRIFVIFLDLSKKMTLWYLETGHDPHVPNLCILLLLNISPKIWKLCRIT
jgi:hypothetical protein